MKCVFKNIGFKRIPFPLNKKVKEGKTADLNRGEIMDAMRYANIYTEKKNKLILKRDLSSLDKIAKEDEATEEKKASSPAESSTQKGQEESPVNAENEISAQSADTVASTTNQRSSKKK